MGEVSRLLVASPRLRPMETFLLILLSSLIGFDAPYFFLFFVYMSVRYLLSLTLSLFFLVSSSDGFICCSIIIPNQAQ